MEIIASVPEDKFYHPMFGGERIPMRVVWVMFKFEDEPNVNMSFSNRDDDPDGMWLADFRSSADGRVAFSHGEGDRSCLKQIAGPQIVQAIHDANFV